MIFSKTFVIIILIGIFAAMSSLIKKKVLHVFQPMEFLMMTFLLEFIFMFLLILFSGDFTSLIQKVKTKMTWKHAVGIIIFSLFVTGLSSGMVWLTKKEHISKIDPIIAIISTLMTFIGGVFILNEPAKFEDYIAIALMIAGISIMGYR